MEGGTPIDRWFDATAFSAPPPFTYWNTTRTLPDVRSPRRINLDLSILNDTRLAERKELQFRAEFFNLTNTPRLCLTNTTFGNLQFARSAAPPDGSCSSV